MSALALALALTAAAGDPGVLPAAATSSPRPEECASPVLSQKPEFWAKARAAERGSYCNALARGHTRLLRSPEQALKLAEQALAVAPQSRAALVLRARALVHLGRAAEAWALVGPLLEQGGAKPPLSEDAAALRDLALAAQSSGSEQVAYELLQTIAARAGLLPDAHSRAVAFLEAGVFALSRGPEHLPEAELYLDESRRMLVPGLGDLALAFTALALDRAGRSEQARAAAREASGPWQLESYLTSGKPSEPSIAPKFVFPSAEIDAAIAMLAEARDPKLAEAHWRAYLADPRAGRGRWVEHARQKLGSLARGARGKAGEAR